MAIKKENRKYVFSVEGDTEKWYFDWLQSQINSLEKSKFTVIIDAKVEKSPQKFMKRINPVATPKLTHVCDYESNSEEHVKNFKKVLSEMKNAEKERNIDYELGYTNYTFDLWMILHKQGCNGCLSDRKQYLSHINKAYEERFESLDEYKQYDNFKRCLSKLSFNDVIHAIQRAKTIMRNKENNNEIKAEYKGFNYYKDNPALSIMEPIEEILKECELL